jgi:hypothetical protein
VFLCVLMTFRSKYTRGQQPNTAMHEANKPIQLRTSDASPSTNSAKSTALGTKQFHTVCIYHIYSYCKYNQQVEYIYRIYKELDCTSRLGPKCMQKGTCECNNEATNYLGFFLGMVDLIRLFLWALLVLLFPRCILSRDIENRSSSSSSSSSPAISPGGFWTPIAGPLVGKVDGDGAGTMALVCCSVGETWHG